MILTTNLFIIRNLFFLVVYILLGGLHSVRVMPLPPFSGRMISMFFDLVELYMEIFMDDFLYLGPLLITIF